ncbi:hypothetical protein N7452_002101 [Penicillium brevicompactum]|uniref:ACB domain-containing protein n=1 Tax=Penicillium brevicompactum TaxID=5074 RepID=A0A9W9UQ49_PENBR|nr:hypothetical protein N7452_002101 [Penicillium brevicompactum]
MADITPFITVLEAAQKKEKFTAEVQTAAEGIDVEVLKAAFAKVSEQGEFEKLDDAAEAETLQKAFEFAAKAVMMLQKPPRSPGEEGPVHLLQGQQGRSYGAARQKKQLFGAWESVKDYSVAKANQRYIEHVNNLIVKYGTVDN